MAPVAVTKTSGDAPVGLARGPRGAAGDGGDQDQPGGQHQHRASGTQGPEATPAGHAHHGEAMWPAK